MRLDDCTLARITRALNNAAVPCSFASEPARNGHRPGTAWQIPTVQAILANPVYTGHGVWNRTYSEHELVDEDNLALGFVQHIRHAAPDQWVISIPIAHEALVSEEQFVAIQSIHSLRPDQIHTYQYTGLLLCGQCSRRMEGTWSNGGAAYRCRHGHFSTNSRSGRTPNAYIGESDLLARMPLLHIRLTHNPALPITAKGQASVPRASKCVTAIPTITTPTPEEVISPDRIDAAPASGENRSQTPKRAARKRFSVRELCFEMEFTHAR